ncbi:MAG: hypothetical protein U5L73_11425 [Rhodoferax sp.]|nr:hypothetical protein [Rhodoferax sp.]
MTYKEQLLHPNWQRKRLEILQRDDFACKLCLDKESTLHVHHKQYGKGRMAWEYPNDELVTLCEACHDTMHEQQGMLRDVTAKLPVDGPGCIDSARCMLAGWANGLQGLDFSQVFEEDPHNYVVGEVASTMESSLGLDHLFALLSALRAAPRWVVHAEVMRFVDALRQNAEKPAPESYVQSMNEGLGDL